MRRLELSRVFVAVIAAALCSCASQSIRIPAPLTKRLSPAESREIITHLSSCDLSVQTFRGLARASLVQGKERGTFRYVIVFSKPDSLRLEALPLSSVYTLSLLTTDAQTMTYLDPAAKTAHRGPVNAAILKRYLGVPILPSNLMSLLTGCAPAGDILEEGAEVFEDMQTGMIQVRSKGLVFEMTSLSFEPRRAFLINRFDEHVAMQVEWAEFRDVLGHNLPAAIKITIPEYSVALSLNFTSAEVNGNYPERLFQVTIPDDFKIE